MFGSRVGFSRPADLMVQPSNFINADSHLGYTKIAITAQLLPIDVMFVSKVGFSD